MFQTKCKTIAALLAASFLLATIGLGHFPFTARSLFADSQKQPAQVPVQNGKKHQPKLHLVKPKRGGLDITTTQPATLEAFEYAELFSAVSGYSKNQAVDIGDRVKKGQVLAEIDSPKLAVAVKQAGNEVNAAQAEVESAKAFINIVKAELEAAKTTLRRRETEMNNLKSAIQFCEKQLRRVRELMKTKNVDDHFGAVDDLTDRLRKTRDAADVAKINVKAAKGNFPTLQAKLAKAKADLNARTAHVHSAKVALEKAEIWQSYTKIRSPYDGIVSERGYHNGDFIRPGAPDDTRPLFKVESTDKMRLVVYVPDRYTRYTNVGDRVAFTIPVFGNYKSWTGKISRHADFLNKKHAMRAEVDVPNPTGFFRHGMVAKATLYLEKGSPKAFNIPISCMVPGPAVYVIRNGKPQKTAVRDGGNNGTRVTILSGLTAADQVVANPEVLEKSEK